MSVDVKTWGNTIWYLFHGLIHNLDDNKFNEFKEDFLYIFKTISNNLPCPDCSKDAKEVISKTNFNIINSKIEMEKYIFNFHNHVNKKLKKKEFEFYQLEMYKKINIDAVINNFIIIFSKKSNVPELMATTFIRQNVIPNIIKKLQIIKKYII